MKVGTDRPVPKSACTACGYGVDLATCVGSDRAPQPGDITLCIKCGHIMAFGDDMQMRNLTDEEMREVASNKTILAIQRGRAAVEAKLGPMGGRTKPMTKSTVDLRERIALCKDFSPAERDLILSSLAATDPQADAVDTAPNYLGRIEHIWMVLSVDDGGEGIVSAPLPGVNALTIPLVAADARRLTSIRPMAQQIARGYGKVVRIAKFTKREDVDIFRP